MSQTNDLSLVSFQQKATLVADGGEISWIFRNSLWPPMRWKPDCKVPACWCIHGLDDAWNSHRPTPLNQHHHSEGRPPGSPSLAVGRYTIEVRKSGDVTSEKLS